MSRISGILAIAGATVVFGRCVAQSPVYQQPADRSRAGRSAGEKAAANKNMQPAGYLAPLGLQVIPLPVNSLPLLVGGNPAQPAPNVAAPPATQPTPNIGIPTPGALPGPNSIGLAQPVIAGGQLLSGAGQPFMPPAMTIIGAPQPEQSAPGQATTGDRRIQSAPAQPFGQVMNGMNGALSGPASYYITPFYITPVWLGMPESDFTVTERMPILTSAGFVYGTSATETATVAAPPIAAPLFGVNTLDVISLSSAPIEVLAATSLQPLPFTFAPSDLPADSFPNHVLPSRILPWPVTMAAAAPNVPAPTPYINNGLLYGGGLGAVGIGNLASLATTGLPDLNALTQTPGLGANINLPHYP